MVPVPKGYFLDESFGGKYRPFRKWGNTITYLIALLIFLIVIWIFRASYCQAECEATLENTSSCGQGDHPCLY
jgi:hypothetical protein